MTTLTEDQRGLGGASMTQAAYYDAYRHTAQVHDVSEAGRRLLNYLVVNGRSDKATLQRAMSWSDRKVRKEVELLKRAGVPVLASSGDGSGYWLSESITEIEEYIGHELESRIRSLDEQRDRLHRTVLDVRARLRADA